MNITTKWPRIRLRHLSSKPIQNGIGESAQVGPPDWPRYVRITDIEGPRRLRDDTFASLPPELALQAQLNSGDLLICAVGATFGKSYLHGVGANEKHCFAGYLVKVSASAAVLPEFIAYWTESSDYWDQVNSRVIQTTIQNFSAAKVKNLSLAIPTTDIQHAIVSFLNRKTAEADALVAKYERLIELLEEKRVALITHAVTKGLDSTVPTIDSGVEWIGDIPGNWDIRPLSHITSKITNGYVGPTRDILRPSGVKYLQSLHIKLGDIKFKDDYYVDEIWSRQHSKSILREGDVLIVQTGEIGQVAFVTRQFQEANCHALIIVSPMKCMIGEFLTFVLLSTYGQAFLKSIQTGATHPHLNCGNVKELRIPVPFREEQNAIVEHVRSAMDVVKTTRITARRAIELIKERRSALITAAVTGQIDVSTYRSKNQSVEVLA